jgi:putative hydrolase of the HAD superfamily
MISKPKMIMFDFGDTILKSTKTNFLEGTRRILEISENPKGATAEEIQELADRLIQEVYVCRDQQLLEMSCQSFDRYIYEYHGVKLIRPLAELERVFWDVAFTWTPTEGILNLFEYMDNAGIRKGIISNISFTGDLLRHELSKQMPDVSFDFIIASVDYCFRKPSPRLFELALKKAGLSCSEVWYAGDRHEYDVKGAVASKLHPVWYNTCGVAEEAACDISCLKVTNWADLIGILERL